MKLAIQIMCWITTIVFSLTVLNIIFDPSIVNNNFVSVIIGIFIVVQSVSTLYYLKSIY